MYNINNYNYYNNNNYLKLKMSVLNKNVSTNKEINHYLRVRNIKNDLHGNFGNGR